MFWKKNKQRLGVGGSRQQMLAGGLVRDGADSQWPLDPGLARNAPGALLHHPPTFLGQVALVSSLLSTQGKNSDP